MSPVFFDESNTVFAKDQPEYIALPAYNDGTMVISCWKLTFWERIKLLVFGRIWLLQMHFGMPLQPQKLSVESPFEVN